MHFFSVHIYIHYFKHKHSDLSSIFDKKAELNIHCFNETSNRVNKTSNLIKPCEFHIKHCSQSERNLSGIYCVIYICVVQREESIFKALKTSANQKRKPANGSRISSYFAKEQRRDSKYFFQ